ncbi:MAG TPA: CDP-alcohol phosphatidyltransferase family protein [Terriglobia bacterium]|jgi:cardiolipin synthase|nr:CDP-alcohol phosphatidyltransferase family protein [Terriglobia bacterium]
MSSRVLSPANEITILRLIFVPIFAILVVDHHELAALVVLGAAALSDLADGFVARRFHQQTPLGVALDPIADKVLMTTAFLVLAFRGALPWWLAIVVISRDVGILLTAGAISLVAGYRPFPPSLLGKASTMVQVITVFTALAARVHVPLAEPLLVRALVDLTAVLAAASGLHYLFLARHRFGLPASPESGGARPQVPKVKVRVKIE